MHLRHALGWVPLLGFLVIGAGAMGLVAGLPSVHAQSSPIAQKCRAAMIIDRSGSVDLQNPNNMQTIRNQIRRLFEPVSGIYDQNVELAFWSFSATYPPVFGNIGNYNAPFHGYISSAGPPSASFNAALNSLISTGNTNYQQAFAYNGTVRNLNLEEIINQTNILVFMTDGQPNAVNQGGVTALEAGRQAAQKHLDAGRSILGGSIGADANQVRVINYVISNDYNNYNNTFTVSTSYNDLARKLKQEIGDKCRELFPPDPCPYNAAIPRSDPRCVPPVDDKPPYTLLPLVNTDNTVIASDESASFSYRITNESATNTSQDVGWSVKRVVVDRGQSTDPLQYGTDTYRDGMNCSGLLNLISNRGTCDETVTSGTKKFAPGITTLTAAELGAASRLVIEDQWPVGTKVCYVLTLARPTEKDSPKDRSSRAVCVVIGKRPTVHVYGGDISVGKKFAGDTEPLSEQESKVQAGLTIKGAPVNKVFGSWVEYGVFAPGPVIGVASAAGLEGGFPGSTAAQAYWSRLTFANVGDSYGSFTEAWTHPDTAGALLAGGGAVTQVTTNDMSFNGSAASGVYEKQSGDLRLTAGKLDKNSRVVVHVPNGTVTIDGNLEYSDGPYASMKEIPRLVIIARAIHIKAAVTQVDGWLIARNSATSTGGGVIDTCSDGPATLSVNDCERILRVNGPVMARTLLLRRTGGAGGGEASGDPAEIINLRADTYLSSMSARSETVLPMTTSTVELPPRF